MAQRGLALWHDNMYNKTLSSILDRHANKMRWNVQMRPHAPWYNDTLKELQQNLCAKDKIWRKSKHRSAVMKDKLQNSTKEYFSKFKRFRREHYHQTISSASTQELYKEIDKMTIEKAKGVLPTHKSKSEMVLRFSLNFEEKMR